MDRQLAGALAVVALWSMPAYAAKGIIDVPFEATAGSVGEAESWIASYWGQSFVALGNRIKDFHFWALDAKDDVHPGSFDFRVLLVKGEPNATGTRTVLFESEPISIDVNTGTEIAVNMDCAKLREGEHYTWIIDAYSTRDGILDWGSLYTTEPGSFDYPDGQIFLKIATGLGRETDLNSEWCAYGFDTAFHMSFAHEHDSDSTEAVDGSCPKLN